VTGAGSSDTPDFGALVGGGDALTCGDAPRREVVTAGWPKLLAPATRDPYGSTTCCADDRDRVPQVVSEVIRVGGERGAGMHCPYCRHEDSRVVDSRSVEDGSAIRRRRQCPDCGRRFTTVETAALQVIKRSGVQEPFSRSKVVAGVRKACQGRPVTDDDLAFLAQAVEDNVRASGNSEVPSQEVGLAILGPLRELDEVAYLRFASVYRGFGSLADFEDEISLLRAEVDVSVRVADIDVSGPERVEAQ